jgi:hypothetical protein
VKGSSFFYGMTSLERVTSFFYGMTSLERVTSFGMTSLERVTSYGMTSLERVTSYGMTSLERVTSYGMTLLQRTIGMILMERVTFLNIFLNIYRTSAGQSTALSSFTNDHRSYDVV